MAELGELIARAEAATGPSRELDCDLCLALSYTDSTPEPLNLRRSPDDEHWLDFEIKEEGGLVDCTDNAPRLTASIDAANALVERKLPGWTVRLHIHPTAAYADLYRLGDLHHIPAGISRQVTSPYYEGIYSNHRLPALAIILALLRAIAAVESSHA